MRRCFVALATTFALVLLVHSALAACPFKHLKRDVGTYEPIYTGPGWQGATADVKQAALAEDVYNNTGINPWYSLVTQGQLFIEKMKLTFDSYMDDMPAQKLFLKTEARKKVIHTEGAVASAEWVDLGGHNYTGAFGGCPRGIIRMSHALEAVRHPPTTFPALAFKCLRNGIPSGNVLAFSNFVGYPTYNFFAHDVSNHVGVVNPHSSKIALKLKLTKKQFQTESFYAEWLGSLQFANGTAAGAYTDTPNFPWRIIYHPTTELHKWFPSNVSSDPEYFVKILRLIPANSTLYHVYVQDYPDANVTGPIARIRTTGPVTSSLFGDTGLFFQHSKLEDDLALKPQWQAAVDAIYAKQVALEIPYTYPDLPFN